MRRHSHRWKTWLPIALLCLAPAALKASTVTYTLGSELQFTTSDYLPNLADTLTLSAPDMKFCNACASSDTGTFGGWAINTQLAQFTQVFYGPDSSLQAGELYNFYPGSLSADGTYQAFYGTAPATLTVVTSSDPVTFAPEPSSAFLLAFAAFLIPITRNLRRSRSFISL